MADDGMQINISVSADGPRKNRTIRKKTVKRTGSKVIVHTTKVAQPEDRPAAADLIDSAEPKLPADDSAAAETEVVEAPAEDRPLSRKNPLRQAPKKVALLQGTRGGKALPATGKETSDHIFTSTTFDSLGLSKTVVHQITAEDRGFGFQAPTVVQRVAIPSILHGTDVYIKSETGSGKTLTFVLPIMHQLLSYDPPLKRGDGTFCLVIAPTRELAQQILDVFERMLKPFHWLVCTGLTGGEKRKSEKARLRKGVQVVVGTPGRLLDHLYHTDSFRTAMSSVRYLIMDEADRLMDLGFEKQVTEIISILDEARTKPGGLSTGYCNNGGGGGGGYYGDDGEDEYYGDEGNYGEQHEEAEEAAPAAPAKDVPRRQTIMCSATNPSQNRTLVAVALHNPTTIDADELARTAKKQFAAGTAPIAAGEGAVEKGEDALVGGTMNTPVQLQQFYFTVPMKWRLVHLVAFLRRQLLKSQTCKVVVFMSCCDSVDFHHTLLSACWPFVVAPPRTAAHNVVTDLEELPQLVRLHGNVPQQERVQALKHFAKCSTGVLLATDVAARGLDLPVVTWILQMDPPQESSEYVHRVGRTARSGKAGAAALFLTPDETEYVKTLEKRGLVLAPAGTETILGSLVHMQPPVHLLPATADKTHKFSTGDASQKAEGLGAGIKEDDGGKKRRGAKGKALVGAQAAKSAQQQMEFSAVKWQWYFEELVASQPEELSMVSAMAYQGFIRAYATHSRDTKHIFQPRGLHFGHVAKSFALRQTPSRIGKVTSEAGQEKKTTEAANGKTGNRLGLEKSRKKRKEMEEGGGKRKDFDKPAAVKRQKRPLKGTFEERVGGSKHGNRNIVSEFAS